MVVVSLHDHLYKFVTNNVLLIEVDEFKALDIIEDVFRFFETALLTTRQVDLRLVSGHNGLRTEANSREEHLHLFARRVLCFVEDDERVGKCPATHERKRRDLDDPLLEHLRNPFAIDEVE